MFKGSKKHDMEHFGISLGLITFHFNWSQFGLQYIEITSGLTSIAADDIMMIGIDMTNLKFYIGINGTWLNSADPVAGTNAPATLNSGSTYLPVCADYGYADVVTLKFNFGNGYFGTDAISSEGTNASNIGKFEYNVPTGFTALSTKGLNS